MSLSKHFVVSNFNTDPSYYLDKFERVTVYDQSDDQKITKKLMDKNDSRIKFVGRTFGHNLLNYLDYIIDNYDCLSDVIVFTKGNVPGRHCNDEWFNMVLSRDNYEFIWNDDNLQEKKDVQYRLYPGRYIEINNSWYVAEASHRYFLNFDDFCNFIFKDYKRSNFVLFSPGACYQVERVRIARNPKSFYQGLRRIIEYTFRPAECFMLERALNLIFDRTYELRDYCSSEDSFIKEIEKRPDVSSARKRGKDKGRIDHFLWVLNRTIENTILQRSERRNSLHIP